MRILNSTDKKKIIEELSQQFGIKKIPYLLLQFGMEKLRIYSGGLPKEELSILDKELRIETAGLYFLKFEKNGIRLNFDAVSVFGKQITKNILDINDEDAKKWLGGEELSIKTDKGFKILKNKGEFIGCGKSTGEKITNFVPKERRIKN